MPNPVSTTYDNAVLVARRRLESRSTRDPRSELESRGITAKDLNSALELWSAVANVFGVEAGKLHPDDSLAAICRLKREDLTEIDEALWKRTGFGEFVEIHSYDLMHHAEKAASRQGWNRIRETFHPSPNTEEEWIDRIMSMTVMEYVEMFSVLARA
jgi:hypothetical protein